ncbi:hypothetical protein EDB89DRAFT_1014056 [Lactarius sanguifluus]|nr:hypothetical protein EDB89DRAFT_1014056 [Lactarius sanguifluus]
MTAQSVVKHLLTEGDKLLISRLSPLTDQGSYAIASRYCSLVVRRVPTHRRDFTHILLQISVLLPVIVFQRERPRGAADRGRITVDPPPPLHTLPPSPCRLRPVVLAVSNHIGAASVTSGPLRRAYCARSGSTSLRWHIMVYSRPRSSRVCMHAFLRAQSRMMAAASTALVWANTASMAVHALYAWRFARRFCKARAAPHRQWETERALGPAALPPPLCVRVAFAAAAVCTRWSADAHADVRLLLRAQRWQGDGCLSVCLVV